MATTVTEKWESRAGSVSGKSPGLELVFTITGTTDDATAEAALVAELVASYNPYRGLVADQPRIERIGQDAWLARVQFGELEPTDTGDVTFEGDTSGGSTHITQSLATVSAYKSAAYGGTVGVNDFRQGIGSTPDSIEGVDILTPVFRFTVSKKVAVASVTSAYLATLFALTGKVNNANYQPYSLSPTFAAGELLFEGARWRQANQDAWNFTYRFAGSPNVSGLTVGDIGPITKAGHDYLWFRYADQENTTLKQLCKRAIAAYVERVYEQADFSTIGL